MGGMMMNRDMMARMNKMMDQCEKMMGGGKGTLHAGADRRTRMPRGAQSLDAFVKQPSYGELALMPAGVTHVCFHVEVRKLRMRLDSANSHT
jgi:hypothetical protein